MLLSFSIVPIGAGTSLGKQVSTALKIIEKSGLPYKITPMDTVVEGEWHEVMDLIKKCQDEIMKTEKRGMTIMITLELHLMVRIKTQAHWVPRHTSIMMGCFSTSNYI